MVQQGLKTKVLSPPHPAYTELLLSSVPEMDPDWLTRLLEPKAPAPSTCRHSCRFALSSPSPCGEGKAGVIGRCPSEPAT